MPGLTHHGYTPQPSGTRVLDQCQSIYILKNTLKRPALPQLGLLPPCPAVRVVNISNIHDVWTSSKWLTHTLPWKISVSAHLLFKCGREMKDSFLLKLKRTVNKQFRLNTSVYAKTSSAPSCQLTCDRKSILCDILFNTIRCIGSF